jgi:hypothetical protein
MGASSRTKSSVESIEQVADLAGTDAGQARRLLKKGRRHLALLGASPLLFQRSFVAIRKPLRADLIRRITKLARRTGLVAWDDQLDPARVAA